MQWQTSLPLIAILRGITPDEALAHVGAAIAAGFDTVEIPLNSPQWQQSIPAVVEAYGAQALIGAGTVLQEAQVDRLAQLGARLVVTPNVQPAVIRRAVGHGMTVCAGCATASEAFTALEAGAQALKIFPSSAFGPDYIRGAESGFARVGAGICRRRRHAGKPGAMDRGRLCGRGAGQRSLSRRSAGNADRRAGRRIC
ncbi:2-dehydro-3-deoxy-6-phosphogalactonate aldolase [Klebsiella variicola]|uniref:2-dehydro-3-deoxy-6-phosphogalactonate aldolase n=1 Tax=Klebsiella variicola TaxID=244366 RepID=A0A7H4MML4_KLEVA|nr:2-dehydro-3-deoxy-6-phosphogalactonate aldolase [Klebsiella variicola]